MTVKQEEHKYKIENGMYDGAECIMQKENMSAFLIIIKYKLREIHGMLTE